MQDFNEFVAGKNITVMGLGLLGRGIGDCAFLAQCGANVLVTDRKTEAELMDSVAQLKKYPNITFRLGEHHEEDFVHCDMVLKAAGVPRNSPYIAAARNAGVPVVMSTALFAKYARDKGVSIVGVTGTRGKSTVTQMIFHAIQLAGKRVLLGGNVRGVSTLALLPTVLAGDIAVLELDSWQLQGFGDLGISPDVSIFTNLMPDHQNYYPDMETYFADKANIFKNQKEGDVLVCGKGIEEQIKAARPLVAPQVPPAISTDWKLHVVGEHNRENAALAAAALHALGLTDSEIQNGLESFTPVEGRLQLIGEIRGASVYNDNNATTPDATLAALHALDRGNKNIILIMGGADKGLDMSTLLYEVARTCKRVILLAGTGTDRVAPFMSDYSIYDSMQSAVTEAVASASVGDCILFSPAFASFGIFKNEYDRNDQFMDCVRSLQ